MPVDLLLGRDFSFIHPSKEDSRIWILASNVQHENSRIDDALLFHDLNYWIEILFLEWGKTNLSNETIIVIVKHGSAFNSIGSNVKLRIAARELETSR